MFFNSEDDEQDFLNPGGSKLASVFGMDKASSQGGNESLTYTAPKQPKKKENSGGGEGGAAGTGVTAAMIVHAYKLVDNQYTSQGKVGAAILTNHAAHEYRILLYLSKQQPLTSAKITSTFAFSVQANNYANFYDDARINWSIMFASTQDAEKFAKEVGLCKALSSGSQPTGLVHQELQLGEGGGLEIGDSVEVKYTGWLLSNNSFGQIFDSNTSSDKLFRFKVGKGKVIKGWDQGMLGMCKGSKRLLVIPPNLAYGSQGVGDRVPANATLIFEVEVIRVKLQRGEQSADLLQPPASIGLPGDSLGSDYSDDTIKERSKSITEQLSNSPKSDKARLISRMAKMGQPMLPNMSGAVPVHIDSDEESPPVQPVITKPQLPSKPHFAQMAQTHIAQTHVQMAGHPMAQSYTQPVAHSYAQPLTPQVDPALMSMGVQNVQPHPAFLQNLPGTQQLSVYQPQPTLLQQQQTLLAMQQQQQMAASQTPGFMAPPTPLTASHSLATHSLANSSAGLVPGSSSTDAMVPVLLSESRQQNTEMRMAVSKMSDKVDRILEKIENLNSQGNMQQALPAPTMETSILLHNISRIVQENERLKKEVFERGEKIESQNDKIAELLQKNQRYVEKSNTILEERNEGYKLTANQSQSRILALEQEKVQLATELSSSSALLATLQLELGELRKKEGELRQQLQSSTSISTTHMDELERLRIQRTEDERQLTDLTASLREEKTARKQSEQQLTSFREELTDLKTTCSTLERNVNERKRKATEERKKMEEEVEEVKAGYEKEILLLQEKLRKQRSSTDFETADKVSKIEQDLTAEWKTKCDKLLAAAADKHSRQVASLKDDLEEAQAKAARLEAKLQELKSSSSSSDVKILNLQQQLEENAGFKDKYDSLRGQATIMKQRYEERILELEEEVENLMTSQRELQRQLQQSRQQLQQTQQQQKETAAVSSNSYSSVDVATEVKKVMNSVYQSLREEFEAEENYTGREVMSVILAVIKETTLKLVQVQPQGKGSPDEEEESEEEEQEETEAEKNVQEEEKMKKDEEVEEREENKKEEKGKEDEKEGKGEEHEKVEKEEEDVKEEKVEEEEKEEHVQETVSETVHKVSEDPPIELAKEIFQEDSTQPNVHESVTNYQPSDVLDGQFVDKSEQNATAVEAESEKESSEAESVPETVPNESFHTPPSSDLSDEQQQQQTDQKEDKLADVQLQAEEVVEISGNEKPPEVLEDTQKSSSTPSDEAHSKTGTESAVIPILVSREPPPLFDDDDDSLLFESDETIIDILGSNQKPAAKEEKKKEGSKLSGKKDLLAEDDLQPPPPLFGDDDDDDDLDWLS